jgi:phosphoribosylformylglycinamidine synthase
VKARVFVYPRPEILDPEGKAIRQALDRLGFTEVGEVRAGRSFDIDLEVKSPAQAEKLLRQMCDKLLANPVVEDFCIELLEDEA